MTMTNAWDVTESEYRTALERARDGKTPPQDSADYWQLCRFYRGQIFYRDNAARAVRLIRGLDEPPRDVNYDCDPIADQRMDASDFEVPQ